MNDALSPADADTTPKSRWLILLPLCLAVLVAQVDTFIVNLAVRPIGQYFGTGVDILQWIVDSYNLVYAVLLLSGGLLADLYGRRRIFMIGAAVFTAASLVCAMAPSVAILIGGRALAGFGAALLIPASLAIIRVVWRDPAERGRALGTWAACNGVAMAIGPSLGGFLIAQFGWRSIFLVVIPLGLAAIALAWRAIPESSDPQGRSFDALAQALGALALGSLAFAAIRSHAAPGIAFAALIVTLVALALFITTEAKHGAAALVPLDIFKVREFRGAMTATAGMTFGGYGLLFVLPLAWQSGGVFDATGAGIALLPMAVVFVLISPFSGALAQRLGARVVTAGGVAIMGVGLLLIGLSGSQTMIALAEIGLALTGFGLGLATGPLAAVAVGAVAAARSGTAAALINTARIAGATIGVAVLGAVYAMSRSSAEGLRLSMVLGGLIQIVSAYVAWRATQAAAPAKR